MYNKKLVAITILVIIIISAAVYYFVVLIPHGPTAQPYLSNITITNSSGSNVNGVYIINGTVQNMNNFSITVVNLNATGYNINGTIVDTGDGFTTSSPISPGGTSNFTISIYDPEKFVTQYQVQINDASK